HGGCLDGPGSTKPEENPPCVRHDALPIYRRSYSQGSTSPTASCAARRITAFSSLTLVTFPTSEVERISVASFVQTRRVRSVGLCFRYSSDKVVANARRLLSFPSRAVVSGNASLHLLRKSVHHFSYWFGAGELRRSTSASSCTNTQASRRGIVGSANVSPSVSPTASAKCG